jgi:hypothetical protein
LEYVTGQKSFTSHEFLAEFRTLKVEPIAREVIGGDGIYDIQVIDVFLKTLVAVYKIFDTWSVLLENRTYCSRVVWIK